VKGVVTFTVMVQRLPWAIVPPVRLTEPLPAVAEGVPPQVLLRPLGVATTRLAGKLSVKATPVRVVAAFGFDSVKLRLLTPLG
jgi:hypothetical protein